ncbi:MAG: ATP-binding cassette domain-containing protein [Thermoanaerobaculia bacterium]|nr:ATP-binding cassette domain-containing protein [Thermoanaerobaculia bacterium]
MRSTVRLDRPTLVIGRSPECDVVLDSPIVSARHAKLQRTGDGWQIEDLGSTNGTYVNGRRVSGSTLVAEGDLIGLGSFTFNVLGPDRIERRDLRGNLSIEAREIGVTAGGRQLIDGISLTIHPGELVGLMGPSGAGKTTLMCALNGYARATSGETRFNGLDLFAHYGQFRQIIGFVPQDDIMHRELTVRQALYFSARLRLPEETTDAEIRTSVARVLTQLELESAADVLIGSPEKRGISGGQRKRVNLAMELITDPQVLFLDEPTSGLSSEDALTVMKLLRQLADEGKTILLTIHQPSLDVYRLMDHLVLLAKDANSTAPARLAYFGPAHPDAAHFLDPATRAEANPPPETVLRSLKSLSTDQVAERYLGSSYRRTYVDERRDNAPPAKADGNGARRSNASAFLQWWTLVRRGWRLKWQDRWNLGVLLAQAPLIGALIAAVFETDLRSQVGVEHWPVLAQAVPTILFLMAVSALWFGCSNAAREIVGEWSVYQRERMINLRLSSYIGAKFTILGTICLAQCIVLMAIVDVVCSLQGPWWPMLPLLVLTSWIGVAMGLLVSGLARSSEVAIAVIPLVILPQVILGGMMQPVHRIGGMVEALAHVTASRWAFEGLVGIESEKRVPPGDCCPELAVHFFPPDDQQALWVVVAVLVSMWIIFIGLLCAGLRCRDVH